MVSSAYFAVACACLAVLVGANTVGTSPGSHLGSASINAAGIAVIFGSLAAWWLAERARKEPVPASRDVAGHEVLHREGGVSVITRNHKALQDKIDAIKQDGPDKLQVIADFDMTLTSFRLPDGSRGMSTHGILERSGYFGEAFTTRAKEIFNRYYPIEVDPTVSTEDKWAAMSEWWETTHALLVQQRLSKDDVAKAVSGGAFSFRRGVDDMLAALEKRKVPLLVFSAGIADVLHQAFKQRLGSFSNLSIVSNEMDFSAEGVISGFKNKTIHIMNKGAVALRGTPHYHKIAGRDNVLLLGDSLGDLRMADGLSERNVTLTVGFLNDKIEERREQYLAEFDVVIEGDGPMTDVNNLILRQILDQ